MPALGAATYAWSFTDFVGNTNLASGNVVQYTALKDQPFTIRVIHQTPPPARRHPFHEPACQRNDCQGNRTHSFDKHSPDNSLGIKSVQGLNALHDFELETLHEPGRSLAMGNPDFDLDLRSARVARAVAGVAPATPTNKLLTQLAGTQNDGTSVSGVTPDTARDTRALPRSLSRDFRGLNFNPLPGSGIEDSLLAGLEASLLNLQGTELAHHSHSLRSNSFDNSRVAARSSVEGRGRRKALAQCARALRRGRNGSPFGEGCNPKP